MATTKQLVGELLNMNLKDFLRMKTHLEKSTGMEILPTINLSIRPSSSKQCKYSEPITYEVVITKVGERADEVRAILQKMGGLPIAKIERILKAGKGKVKKGAPPEEAESIKSALDAVGAEVVLK